MTSAPMHPSQKLVKLGRTSSHRKALFRNMVTSLIKHERIETTLAKAKALRRIADRMITLGKKATNPELNQRHARVKIMGYVRTRPEQEKLWSTLAQRYQYRPNGYTRVIRTRYRYGDHAPLAYIEYVDRPGELRKSKPMTAASFAAWMNKMAANQANQAATNAKFL